MKFKFTNNLFAKQKTLKNRLGADSVLADSRAVCVCCAGTQPHPLPRHQTVSEGRPDVSARAGRAYH